MRTRYLLFVFVFIMAAAPIYAGTVYYVDATNGSDANNGLTPENPWKTINKVNNSIFVPGDSILFKRGETWRETLTPPSHGSSSNNITFGAYGTGDLPKIDGSTRNYCVDGKKDYITITGLHFAFPNQYGIAHTKWNSSGTELSTPGWIIENCTFTNCGVYLFGPDTVVQDNVFVGPSLTTTTGEAVIIRGAVAVNCSVLRNTISGYIARGVWFLNGANNPTANDNIIHDIGFKVGTVQEGYGINFDGYGHPITGTITASGNTVYNCAANGIEMENCSDASVISRNLVHDCPTGILYMNYAASPRYSEQRGLDVDGIVKYNIIYHCCYGIRLDNVSTVKVWNNTIYDGVGSYPCGLIIFDVGTYYVDNIDFRNNIVGSGMGKSLSSKYAWKNHFITLDYCADVNPVMEIRSPSSTLTLAQLQAGSAALNCFTTSPGFVNAAGHDFHLLSSSPCINAGVFVGLTQDYEGNSIKGTPDIGAYESGLPTTTTPPWVTTTVPSAIQSTSATGGGIVTADGGATVTERGVCWGLAANPAISGSHTHDGSGTGSYISSLTGLSQNTTYHVRAYATNSSGTGYGSDIAFTTSQDMTLPSVTTSAVTSITSASAAGGGSVTSDGGATVTERGLCWGLTANPEISGSHTDDGSGTGSYVSSLTGLSPNTTYHVRAYATNTTGTGYGNDVAFTTSQGMTLPSVTTSEVTSITSTSAAGGGSVTSEGGATVTERGLCWGLTANPEISGSHTDDGSGTGSFVSSLTGLSPDTTYHVRAYATNSSGTGYGSDVAFTTSQGMTLPSVTTSAVTSITSTSAAGGGSVTSDGGATVTERGLCWGLTTNPEISGSHTDDGSGTGSFVSSLTGLSPDTTYHVRAYATNSSGTGYGDDVSFMTLALSKYSIPFSESFSGLILPADWTTRNEGTGIVEKWAISETAFSGGSPNEAIYSWQDVDPGTSRLVTPPIDTTGYSVLNMSFKHVLETFNSGGITIKIQTSPDGSTWTDEAWSVLTASSNTGPETVQTMLTQNLNRTTTYVAFVITGNLHYFDVWYIDDVRITATAPGTLKAPVLLTPKNGAMRQPTVINLSWLDRNGSPAEAGHRIRIKPNGGTYAYYTVGQNIQSCKLSRLLTNKKYYWNVLAMGDNDGIADSNWSNSGKDNVFTTKK
jgi:hypothetical protein